MTRNVFDRPGQSSNTGSGSNSYDATGSKVEDVQRTNFDL